MAVPVVIGVGDVKNRSQRIEDAIEPMELMFQAIQAAIKDANLSPISAKKLQQSIDSLDVVATWTWPYPDLPGSLSQKLGVSPSHKHYSPHGGNQPAKLFDDAARRISLGKNKVAVVTGGEALASIAACAAAKKLPPPGWSKAAQNVDSVFSPTTRDLGQNLGAKHSIGAPIHVYPLYENGFRASRGQSIEENNKESAQLYAEFSKVAEHNSVAWNYGSSQSEEVIGTVTKKNRMICFPYPLLMNAFNTINVAGACLLTTVDFAEELGVPKENWIYPLAGAGTSDSSDFWERPNFYSSPSISRSLDTALELSGLKVDQIDMLDIYSCFPIVPKLACQHLGLPLTGGSKPITLLGGLTSFGGAGNNYSMHAITETVRQLRAGKGSNGLILANGGVLSYQHVICLSREPRQDGKHYPTTNPLPEVLKDVPAPDIESRPEGEAVIETYTVEFNRDGIPSKGFIIGRLVSNGRRFVANHGNVDTLSQLSSRTQEQIGRRGWVGSDPKTDGRNLFIFGDVLKL